MAGAQPCWKLAYTGSVGSQALTGIPVVRALRDDPRWAAQARIWPFETGLRLPNDAPIVFAECWPSWWRWRPMQSPGEVNDRAQVRHVAGVLADADQAGELAAWFAGGPGLTAAQRQIVESEEAWTLGVTAPRRAAKPRHSPQVRGPKARRHSEARPKDASRESKGAVRAPASASGPSGPAAARRQARAA